MTKVLQDFKKFLLRGNVVDLAIAVVIGTAFGAVVASLVKDLFTPLFGIIGERDFSDLTFTVRGSVFRYGSFINALIAFLMVAAAVYFFVIVPMNALIARSRSEPKPADPPHQEVRRMPQRDPAGRQALRPLHVAAVERKRQWLLWKLG
ncbi:MAG: large conductance mechanosensitive channel protein MscL [Chloroflexi bacterium]|nr:large conductance mechanosensitive channel protein MscL [Chloroflexota bacterium]